MFCSAGKSPAHSATEDWYLNGSKKVQGTKSMNSDKLDGMQMCHKKKRVRLHITAVKRHVSPIEIEEIHDSDEKDSENFNDLRTRTACLL